MRTGRGSKTGKMSIERVREFKSEMYTDSVINLSKKYNEISYRTLCQIRAGDIWRDVKPDSRG